MQSISPDMQHCIDDCLHCYRSCMQESMNHCLETGGRHTEPAHFRLMINCAELCRTAASFMLSNSTMHGAVCAACAQVCEACADSCEQVGGMDDCVRACRACMESCARMGNAGHAGHMQQNTPLQDHLPM